ncbi:unnamed protein product [Musa banksii]
MHSHCLTLTQSGGCGRRCSVCCQATSRLVYQCGPCGFVVHPLCVQGRRCYRCDSCDFDLHENCAKCPQSLSCSMHSHCLTLTQSGGCGRWCSVCCQATSRLVYDYRCNSCDFDLHEYCAKCPQSLSCSMHSHCLTLTQSGGYGRQCSVCCQTTSSLVYQIMGDGLRYRCDRCNFELHEHCARCPSTISFHMHPQHLLTLHARPGTARLCDMADIACMFTCRIMGVVKCTFYIYIDGVAQAFATTPVCKQAEDSQKNETIQDVLIAVTVEKVPNRLQPIISLKSMYY